MTVAHAPAAGSAAYKSDRFRYGVLKTRLSPDGEFASEDCGHTWKIEVPDLPPLSI